MKTILAIETSCDETAVSIVSHDLENKTISIRAHIVESQNESHAPFGGVVPEIAARDHLSKIDFIARQAIEQANVNLHDITAIAVTLGPGLIGALMVGVLYARGMVTALDIPLIGVNHVHAHLAPCFFLPQNFSILQDLGKWLPVHDVKFPVLALTVSGGHCHLSLLKSSTDHELLGYTLDDACGEAFDKVAKLLGLGYPGGAALESFAQQAGEKSACERYHFTQPFLNKNAALENRYNFSYSGLKTAALNHIKNAGLYDHTSSSKVKKDNPNEGQILANIASAFQHAALLQLKTRVLNAMKDYPQITTLFVAGGVAQNTQFRKMFSDLNINQIFAPIKLCSDNATMIALQAVLNKDMDALQMHPFSRYQYTI